MNLLIGGTGFIGSALAQDLIKRNEQVVSIARSGGDVGGVRYISLDLAKDPIDSALMERANNVFILTGQAGPNFSPEAEKGQLVKMLTPLKKGKQRVYFFSSALVYGNSEDPASEEDDCYPIGSYPQFKLAAEGLAQDLLPQERLVIFRLANVYGSPKNRGLIGLAMKKLVDNDTNPLVLNGGGEMHRDYVFIDDVVGAVLAIAGNPNSFGIVNIASGQSSSLKDVVETLSRVTGKVIPYQLSDQKPDEARTVRVANHKLRKHFGYKRLTSLEKGLRKTAARYKKVRR